jgi:hypothetical protein
MITPTSPSGAWAVVSPSDSDSLEYVRGLYIGGTGNVACEDQSGSAVTFFAVPTGFVLPIRPSKVLAATTATNIVALY